MKTWNRGFGECTSISKPRFFPLCDFGASCGQRLFPFLTSSAILGGSAALRKTLFLIWVAGSPRWGTRGSHASDGNLILHDMPFCPAEEFRRSRSEGCSIPRRIHRREIQPRPAKCGHLTLKGKDDSSEYNYPCDSPNGKKCSLVLIRFLPRNAAICREIPEAHLVRPRRRCLSSVTPPTVRSATHVPLMGRTEIVRRPDFGRQISAIPVRKRRSILSSRTDRRRGEPLPPH